MSISTYAELKTAIASWSNRTDLTASIPDFIRLAESVIRREVRCRDMITEATGSLSSGAITIPADYIEARQVVVDSAVPEYVTEEVYQRRQGIASSPESYTTTGTQIKVTGGSDEAYTLSYWAKYDAFSADADTNWLLTNVPEVYLFASLVEVYEYLRDMQGRDMYKTRLNQVVAELNAVEKAGLYIGPMRIRTA